MNDTPIRVRALREEEREAARTLQRLGEMFAGPLPWINDWF